MVRQFSYIKNNEGGTDRNIFTHTGSTQWGFARKRIRASTFSAVCERIIPSWIMSDMKMFAGDTKVWCKIKSETDGITL